ncbi:DUF2125 domain-containing protein [Nitratireductor basaltis]|uniref:DUF2125 domain-containing protein n=1 Tax=Nitratireductor basaltis TaxID=472175 RepID=A0A084U7G3_9HYPH|nr:DUF2125 domain-containing protein [Nitratireductor basaltis]KFB08899.1 hypothetical protein EL18_03154 [Nitratireductor basaltis]
MTSRNAGGSRIFRRFIWFAGAILLAIAAYTGAWFYLAGKLEAKANQTVSELNRNGTRAHCEEPEARGYPFRIGLYCGSIFYEDVRQGFSIRAGAFRSAAQVYQPQHLVGEVDGPAELELPVSSPLTIDWEVLRASARIADPLPQRFSSEARRLTVALEETPSEVLATAELGEFHARLHDGDLQMAGLLRQLAATQALGVSLPSMDAQFAATLKQGETVLTGKPENLRGKEWQLDELVLSQNGSTASIAASGPISIGADGRMNGMLTITVTDADRILEMVSANAPELAEKIDGVRPLIMGLAQKPMELRINNGRMMLGFIPLGEIPPL